MSKTSLYRVRFTQGDRVFDVFARNVYAADLPGFVVVEQLVFDEGRSLVVDPSEEKLKTEFSGVVRTLVPYHSMIRIDEVEKRGVAKIVDIDPGRVSHFPSPQSPFTGGDPKDKS